MTDYELIIRFSSDTPFYEIRSYMIDSLLNEFQNLNMWDLKRVQESLIEKQKNRIATLEKENAELKEKFLKVKTDDIRKSKLDSFKTFEEKNEYLRQVATYAIFNADIGVMLWCFMQRDSIYTEQLTKAKEIIKDILSLGIFGIFKGTTSEEIVEKAEDFIKELDKW